MEPVAEGGWSVLSSGFRILVAGRGNVCRSPVTAYLLHRELDVLAPGEFVVTSAGTEAVTGDPAVVGLTGPARRNGAELRGSAARRVDQAMITAADLIVAMDRELRGEIVRRVPRSLRKTFTLCELARILPTVPPETGADAEGRWRSLVAIAPRYRTAPSGSAADDDIGPPSERSTKAYEQMSSRITAAIDVIRDWEARCQAQRSRA